MKKTVNLSVAGMILLGAMSCASGSKPILIDDFKNSFYEKFPTPPRTLEERADMVEFWCVNAPVWVISPDICAYQRDDV